MSEVLGNCPWPVLLKPVGRESRSRPCMSLLTGWEHLRWVKPDGRAILANRVCRVESVKVLVEAEEWGFRRALFAKGRLKGLGDSPLVAIEDGNILCECPPNMGWPTDVMDGGVAYVSANGLFCAIRDLGDTVSGGIPRSFNAG